MDCQAAEIYVGEYDEVRRRLKKQHPSRQPLTPAEIADAERQRDALETATLNELREFGMFEFLLGATEGQKDKCWAMVAWLDDFITEDLLKAYLAASETGVPAVSGKVIGFDLIKRLADLDTVVAVKQGSLVRAETLKLRRMVREDFIVSDPNEAVFLDDLRHGGQVVWGEMSYLVFGKKRVLVDQYRKLAAEGKWEEAYQVSQQLAPVREFLEDMLIWEIVKTATYAAAVGGIKVWFEELGFNAGSLIAPVAPPSEEKKEWIRSKVRELGLV